MNSFDTTEPNQNISKLFNADCNCTAIDKTTGESCGETETLKIIDEFQKLYETRIENVDHEFQNEFEQVCMKLEISKEWIKSLREQNIMLVQVVEDLEQAACNRVKLLEQKLEHSSILMSGNMSKSLHTEKTINTLSNRVNDLEQDEGYLRQKVEFLQSDIRGLLELIRRAVQENHWNLDDIKFFEIQPSDIPINCTCDQEDTNHEKMQSLKLQIKHFQENERRMNVYQTHSENKLTDLETKLEIKEDTIKEYISQIQNFNNNLKRHAKLTDQIACTSFVTNDQDTFEAIIKPRNSVNQQNQILLYLNKVKSLMEQEKEDLYNLKTELEKTVEKLCFEKDEEDRIIHNECNVDNIKFKLIKNIEYINKMFSTKEELVTVINSLFQIENNFSSVESLSSPACADINQQFKLMDVARACAIEAQITMEDIKNETNVIVSSFKHRHEKYIDLNKEVLNVQNQLIKSQEKIVEAINKLQLLEEEKMKHNERITLGNSKLKNIKNEMNHAQSRLLARITDMQHNENITSGYTEICVCNDLVCSVMEEIEQTSCSLQIIQGGCITRDLEQLKKQFYDVDSSIKKLQEKIDEALLEHDVVETTLSQKDQRLKKLEEEIDVINLKIQNVLETFFSSKEQVFDCNITEAHLYTQTLNEILQIKQDVYKLKKEHDELKYKLSQKLYSECDKNSCVWKSKITDLQDQVKILQHEAKCNEEANNFLRNNIESMEDELHIAQVKVDGYRRSHSLDKMELTKKIIELENTLKLQKEIECTLRQQLNDSEKKSAELLNSSHIEHSMEEALLRCGCYQFRHDTMIVPQLLKTLQNTIRSTKNGLQEFKTELKQLIFEDSNFCSSVRSLMKLMDKLQKYEDELENCCQEIEELNSALYSKDKVIENMDEIIKIQKDSIVMTQTELKELHQKLQEKIDNQDQIISQYETEKKELLKQNELQIQTIGHLQDAVVEAKKCIDQTRHRTVSDMSEQWSTIPTSIYNQGNVHDVLVRFYYLQLEEKTEAIHLLTVYTEETQSQYNECFTEAARQDKLLQLQRDAIHDLQQKISCMEYNHCLTITFIHITYYSILETIQEQLIIHVNDIQALRNKMNTLMQSKCHLENKYLYNYEKKH
ncbi:hypothetical protein ANTQUA_LOCUS528, partial [Anthophora quadrimaculata]